MQLRVWMRKRAKTKRNQLEQKEDAAAAKGWILLAEKLTSFTVEA